jgi:hypothetical protein
MGSINIIFSEDSDCWRSCLYCTSNVATSGFFWTKSQKWWFFFLLKCQKDCGYNLDFSFISEEEKERMLLVLVTPKRKSVEVWWSMIGNATY